jgi:succinyl-CoA synthetase beta subunit
MLVLSLLTLDVGGTADAKRVETVFRIILKDQT